MEYSEEIIQVVWIWKCRMRSHRDCTLGRALALYLVVSGSPYKAHMVPEHVQEWLLTWELEFWALLGSLPPIPQLPQFPNSPEWLSYQPGGNQRQKPHSNLYSGSFKGEPLSVGRRVKENPKVTSWIWRIATKEKQAWKEAFPTPTQGLDSSTYVTGTSQCPCSALCWPASNSLRKECTENSY